MDGRDLPELVKYATGALSEADHAWMFERRDGLVSTDDVVTYLCQRKGLVQERTIDAKACVAPPVLYSITSG